MVLHLELLQPALVDVWKQSRARLLPVSFLSRTTTFFSDDADFVMARLTMKGLLVVAVPSNEPATTDAGVMVTLGAQPSKSSSTSKPQVCSLSLRAERRGS